MSEGESSKRSRKAGLLARLLPGPAAALPGDPDAGAEFRPAWRLGDAKMEADAIAFWERLAILPSGVDPADRARELAAAAYRDGAVIGVTTATLAPIASLRARFALFRCAVDPAHRRGRLSMALTIFTRDLIERWAETHPEEKIAGLAAVIESPDLIMRQKEPYWPTTRLGLVGYTPEGRQLRVAWFEKFRLD